MINETSYSIFSVMFFQKKICNIQLFVLSLQTKYQ